MRRMRIEVGIELGIGLGLGLAISSTALAEEPSSSWQRHWSPGGNDDLTQAREVVLGPDGSSYVAVGVGEIDPDVVLLKYDEHGTLLWSLPYVGAPGVSEGVLDMERTDEGVVLLIGVFDFDSGSESSIALDVSADGLLRHEFHLIGSGFPGFLSPQVDVGADGRRLVATDDRAGSTMQLFAFREDGSVIHDVSIPMVNGGVSAVELGDDGHATVVSVEQNEYVVRNIDEAGLEQWRYSMPGDTGLVLSDAFVVPQSDGGAIIAGSPELDCITIKARVWRHDASGQIVWQRDFPEECEFMVAIALAGDETGDVYLVGHPADDNVLIKIATDGTHEWTRSFDAGPGSTLMRSIAVADGRVLMTGRDLEPNTFQAIGSRLFCYDFEGNLEFTSLIEDTNGSAESLLTAIGAGEGVATAIGTSIPATSADYEAWTVRLRFCEADLNGDGILDIFDVLAFIDAFSDGLDWNGDTVHDIFDVFAYLDDYDEGCAR